MSEQDQHNDAEELSVEDLDQVTGGVAQVGLGVAGPGKVPGTQKYHAEPDEQGGVY